MAIPRLLIKPTIKVLKPAPPKTVIKPVAKTASPGYKPQPRNYQAVMRIKEYLDHRLTTMSSDEYQAFLEELLAEAAARLENLGGPPSPY